MKNTPKILEDTVAVAYVHPNMVHEGFARSLAKACLWPGNKIIAVISASNPRQHVARNSAIDNFLDGPCEYLMWIDTDMTFSHDAIEQLRTTLKRHDAQMATGLGFILKRHDNIVVPNGYKWNPELTMFQEISEYTSGHVYEVDGTGSGFVLIHRSVFEAWEGKNWHQNWMEHPATGSEMGHDLAFCWQAVLQDGAKLIWDTEVKTGHIKHFELDEDSFRQYQETTDAT